MNIFFLEVDWFLELGVEYLVRIRIFKGVANSSWVWWIYWFFKVQPDVQSLNQLVPCGAVMDSSRPSGARYTKVAHIAMKI